MVTRPKCGHVFLLLIKSKARILGAAMGSEWDDVLGQELEETRGFEHEVESCEANRTPSSCGVGADPSEELRPQKPAVWWAVILKAAGTDLGLEGDDGISTSQSPKIHIVSGCTGCGAEAFVLKAGSWS